MPHYQLTYKLKSLPPTDPSLLLSLSLLPFAENNGSHSHIFNIHALVFNRSTCLIKPRFRAFTSIQILLWRIQQASHLELKLRPVHLGRRLLHPKPSLATGPRKPGPPRLVRAPNRVNSASSSQPQAEPSLRPHSRPLKPHRSQASLPLIQRLLRRLSRLRHLALPALPTRSILQQLVRPHSLHGQPFDPSSHSPARG